MLPTWCIPISRGFGMPVQSENECRIDVVQWICLYATISVTQWAALMPRREEQQQQENVVDNAGRWMLLTIHLTAFHHCKHTCAGSTDGPAASDLRDQPKPAASKVYQVRTSGWLGQEAMHLCVRTAATAQHLKQFEPQLYSLASAAKPPPPPPPMHNNQMHCLPVMRTQCTLHPSHFSTLLYLCAPCLHFSLSLSPAAAKLQDQPSQWQQRHHQQQELCPPRPGWHVG